MNLEELFNMFTELPKTKKKGSINIKNNKKNTKNFEKILHNGDKIKKFNKHQRYMFIPREKPEKHWCKKVMKLKKLS